MILGMPPFTFFHVLVSLVGIGSGVVVLWGLLTGRRLDGWTVVFLSTTVATSVTGFGFPFFGLLPSHVVGILSLIILAAAIVARYVRHLAGAARATYVVGGVTALYLNVFVLLVQLFKRNTALHALAPTQTEAPFKLTQLVVLAAFVALTVAAVKRFRPAAA
jgi:hypothetical protein